MKHKKLFRRYHSFYTPKNSLCRNSQEQDSENPDLRLSSLGQAPNINACPYIAECHQEAREICFKNYEGCIVYMRTKVLIKLKPKTGLERFVERYGIDYQEMFVGSRK